MKSKSYKSVDVRLLGLLFLQLVLIFLSFDVQMFMGGDAHSDILLAESILSGKGFTDIWDPHQPQDNWRRPGMPVLIALLYLLFGHNYLVIKILMVLLTCMLTVFLYLTFKDEIGSNLWFLLLLFITNAAILEFAHYELTEIPFLFVMLLAIYFWKKQKQWGTIICLIIASYFRIEALALIGAYLIHFLLQKNWKKLLIFAASILVGILPWTIRSIMIGGNQQIKVLLAKDELNLDAGMIGLSDLVQRIFINFKYYFLQEGGVMVLNVSGFVTALIMLVTFIGLITFYKFSQTGKLILWFVLLHFMVILVWQPQATHYRYLVTVAPFLMLGFVYGFSGFVKFLKGLI